MPKRTYQPSKIRRQRKYGYRARTSSKKGRLTIKRRMAKGRKKITL